MGQKGRKGRKGHSSKICERKLRQRPILQKREGNVGNILTAGLCILAMTAAVTAYLNCMELIQQKTEAGQIARKYILRMETVGCLTGTDQTLLSKELTDMGVTDIDLMGTTMGEVGFGEPVTLNIRGKLKGEYLFEEHRVSTAKN